MSIKDDERINTPEIETTYTIFIDNPEMPVTLEVPSPEDRRRWQCDPDAFAAAYFGTSKETYREWCRAGGAIRCGGVTKEGKPCGNNASGFYTPQDVKRWAERNLKYFCYWHGSERQTRTRTRCTEESA
jgi:hypothetical protein